MNGKKERKIRCQRMKNKQINKQTNEQTKQATKVQVIDLERMKKETNRPGKNWRKKERKKGRNDYFFASFPCWTSNKLLLFFTLKNEYQHLKAVY